MYGGTFGGKRQHCCHREENLQGADHAGMQRGPPIGNWRLKAFDALPSLAGSTPTARHVFGGGKGSNGLACKPGEDEEGDDEPTKPAHGKLRGAIPLVCHDARCKDRAKVSPGRMCTIASR